VRRWSAAIGVTLTVSACLAAVQQVPQAVAVETSAAWPFSQGTIYVVNNSSDTVTPISVATNTALPAIQVGGSPVAIAVTPDGKTAYVANEFGGDVTPIDVATQTAGNVIRVPFLPQDIAVTPDGTTAYVASALFSDDGNFANGAITPIATATNTAAVSIPDQNAPYRLAITPDSRTVYALDEGAITVPTATNVFGPRVSGLTIGDPQALAITPDGTTVYVADDVLTVRGLQPGVVFPVSTATNTAGPAITVGLDPAIVAITPDGRTAYVVNSFSDTITPIIVATNHAGRPIPVGVDPDAIAFAPDGRTAYVASRLSGTVTPITVATSHARQPIPVTGNPVGIVVTPDGRTIYVASELGFGQGSVTPIPAATQVPGPPIPVGDRPFAIVFAPAPAQSAPGFTSGTAATAAFGSPLRFTVTTSGNPVPSITRRGRMPSGLTFTDNRDGTATISGSPANGAAGRYPLTLTARNKLGTATQAFTLTVTRAPSIRKVRTVRARAGVALDRLIRVTGYPAPALAEAGALPSGVTFTDEGNGTAVLAGTPSAGSAGRYRITVTAANASGTAARGVLLLVGPG
jgi:YVTN family beta-propeller protein